VKASAQTAPSNQTPAPPAQAPAQTPAEGRPASADEADLAITARVTARELKFDVVPNPRVEFTGKPRRVTVWEAERHNLPQSVRPGETYRDIGITLRITSVFADIERIVAEALGEIPASEDATPGQTPPTPPAEPPAQQNLPPTSSPPQQQQPAAAERARGATRRNTSEGALRQSPSSPHASPASVPLTQTRTPRRRDARRGTNK
jgi:hypothetical protein